MTDSIAARSVFTDYGPIAKPGSLGVIADDPSDVKVWVNGQAVTPERVIGLLGQIVLPNATSSGDVVTLDYAWLRNPTVDIRRLNSPEFRLNNWNTSTNRPHDSLGRRYRYNNRLIAPSKLSASAKADFAGSQALAAADQPLLRDLKYRGFEREYSALLNNPNLLRLNAPQNKISYPVLDRLLETRFVNYETQTLPEDDPQDPWVRHGHGDAVLTDGGLQVVDRLAGSFPDGAGIFWTQPLDIDFPSVFALTWRVLISGTTGEGVFTGVAAGYSTSSQSIVIGYLADGDDRRIGFLRKGFGNDPSTFEAWENASLDWSVLRSYRIYADANGVGLFVDGSVTAAVQVTYDQLPALEELNAPFDALQGVFFGSLSLDGMSTSTWDFVRHLTLPTNPQQTAPSISVLYASDVLPEVATQPWTPVGFHGTETLRDGTLILDSTSASTENETGLVGGDFRGYARIEPLLADAFDVSLEVEASIQTFTHGLSPNAVAAAFDDGRVLTQLCFVADTAAPKISYGGRTQPEVFPPYAWQVVDRTPRSPADAASVSLMVGQYLQLTDNTLANGRVYVCDDSSLDASQRVLAPDSDYCLEFRAQVVSYTPDQDNSGFAGVMASIDDGNRGLGIQLSKRGTQTFVDLHSGGVIVQSYAFPWDDGTFHTYRLRKAGDQISLAVDANLLPDGAPVLVPYANFGSPLALNAGFVSFGSETPIATGSMSTVLWAYANAWRVLPDASVRKYVGIWKNSNPGTLLDFHLPTKVEGPRAQVTGLTLVDIESDFLATEVQPGDDLIVDTGPNQGAYRVVSVMDAHHLSIENGFPVTPTETAYRVVSQFDWTVPHSYEIRKHAQGDVGVFIDGAISATIHCDSRDLPENSAGLGHTLAGGLPCVYWGALDPTNISQTRWQSVRYQAMRSTSASGIAPHHQVLNQRNVVSSYEHRITTLPHTHTDFWSQSAGTPPQTNPDLLRDPRLTAYTLLNEGTPLVPLKQSNGYRSDVDADLLYSELSVIEATTGVAGLLAPADDEARIQLGEIDYQSTVCLKYDGAELPTDSTAATPWLHVANQNAQDSVTLDNGALVYSSGPTATCTVYRNDTALVGSRGLKTKVTFRIRLVQDGSNHHGDSGVRFGFSSPGVTVGLALITTSAGDPFVYVMDMRGGKPVAGMPFNFLDGGNHTYTLIRDPATAALDVIIDGDDE